MRFPHATAHICRLKGRDWAVEWFDKQVNIPLKLGLNKNQIWLWVIACSKDKSLLEYRNDYKIIRSVGLAAKRPAPSPPEN